jgi:hypothetical protein
VRKAVHLANGKSWRARKDAIEHFRKMLARYKDGQKISDSADESDLRTLLILYDSVVPPGSPTKTGSGVAYFSRELNTGDGWATSGFHVHRTDGTSVDFSFRSAIQTDPT